MLKKKKCLKTYIEFSYKKINKNTKKCREIGFLSLSRGFFQPIKLRKVSNIISGTYSHVFWVARDPFSKQYFFQESRIPLLHDHTVAKNNREMQHLKMRNGLTDGWIDRWTVARTDGRTDAFIEMRECI